MRQSKDGQNILQKTIWDRLAGRRIVLAGIQGECYTRFLENLENLAGQPGFSFEVTEGLEQVAAGDFVLATGVGAVRFISDAFKKGPGIRTSGEQQRNLWKAVWRCAVSSRG